MKQSNIIVIIFLLFVFTALGSGKVVFAQPALSEKTNLELEFLLQGARENIKTQEAIINSLRKRYEGLLNRKKELQQFIDEENKKLKDAELLKSRSSAKPTKPTPISTERKISRGQEKVPKKPQVLQKDKEARREEKEARRRGKEIAKRLRIQEAVLSRQENSEKAFEEKKLLEIEARKKDLESQRNKKSIEKAAQAKKQEKEREALSRKIEKQRLLKEQESQRLISEKECQKRLLLEAEKKNKHEKYVSQLEKLLNKQNSLLEETHKLEFKIAEEEKNLEVLEKTRQDLIKKLLEKP